MTMMIMMITTTVMISMTISNYSTMTMLVIEQDRLHSLAVDHLHPALHR